MTALVPDASPDMADEELQRGAFRGAYAQRRDAPAQGGGGEHIGAANGRIQNAGDDKIGGHSLVDYDIGGACVGDVGGQRGKKLLQVGRVGRNGYVGVVGVRGPVVQGADVHAVRSHKADAVDHDALGAGRRGYGSRRRAGGGVPIGEHNNDLGAAGAGVKQSRRRAEGVGMVGVLPPADNPSTASFKASTEVIIWVSCTAVLEKLTMRYGCRSRFHRSVGRRWTQR